MGMNPTERARWRLRCNPEDECVYFDDTTRDVVCAPLEALSEQDAAPGWQGVYAERTVRELLPMALRALVRWYPERSAELLEAAYKCSEESTAEAAKEAERVAHSVVFAKGSVDIVAGDAEHAARAAHSAVQYAADPDSNNKVLYYYSAEASADAAAHVAEVVGDVAAENEDDDTYNAVYFKASGRVFEIAVRILVESHRGHA